MSLSRPVAVVGAAVVLVGGVTVAVQAATASTDSTQLCVQKNASAGTVYALGAGATTCQKGFKLVDLASADAVAALQAQVATTAQDLSAAQQSIVGLQTDNQTQADEISALTSHLSELDPGELHISGSYLGGGSFDYTVTGSHLKPGADLLDGFGLSIGHVAADGTANVSSGDLCSFLPVQVSTTTAWDDPISVTLTSVPSC